MRVSAGTTEQTMAPSSSVSYTHLDVYKRQEVSIGGVLWSFVVLFLPTDILSTLLAVAVGPRIRKAVQSYS